MSTLKAFCTKAVVSSWRYFSSSWCATQRW